MGIGKVLGNASMLGGAITGKGMFGKGLTALADSGYGMLVPMSYLAQNRRDKLLAEDAAMATAEEDANRNAAVRRLMSGMKKGGKVKAKAKTPKKMAKGGSTASKRGDGCATKGKTRGKMV